MSINIRLANLDDASAMADVHIRSWEVAYRGLMPDDFITEQNQCRLDRFRTTLSAENRFHYVVEKDGVIVGNLSLGPARDDDADDTCYEIYGLYLLPAYFRQGIGSVAMRWSFCQARRLGKSAMLLWVLQGNEGSIKFYQSQGFTFDGSSMKVVYGEEKTVLRMRAIIDQSINVVGNP